MTATPAMLRIRYPAVAAASDEQAQYWLTDSLRFVDNGWGADADPASMAYAAHYLVETGAIASQPGGVPQLPAGVTSFKSASVDISLSAEVVAAQAKGGFGSTVYGLEYLALLRRHNGGPRLVGYVSCEGLGWC